MTCLTDFQKYLISEAIKDLQKCLDSKELVVNNTQVQEHIATISNNACYLYRYCSNVDVEGL